MSDDLKEGNTLRFSDFEKQMEKISKTEKEIKEFSKEELSLIRCIIALTMAATVGGAIGIKRVVPVFEKLLQTFKDADEYAHKKMNELKEGEKQDG